MTNVRLPGRLGHAQRRHKHLVWALQVWVSLGRQGVYDLDDDLHHKGTQTLWKMVGEDGRPGLFQDFPGRALNLAIHPGCVGWGLEHDDTLRPDPNLELVVEKRLGCLAQLCAAVNVDNPDPMACLVVIISTQSFRTFKPSSLARRNLTQW